MDKFKPLIIIAALAFTVFYMGQLSKKYEAKQALQKQQKNVSLKATGKQANTPLSAMSGAPTAPNGVIGPVAPAKAVVQKVIEAIDINKNIVLENENFKATFSNQGAVLRTLILKKYFENDRKTPLNFLSDRMGQGSYRFRLQETDALMPWHYKQEKQHLIFTRQTANGLQLTKTFSILGDNELQTEITLNNTSGQAQVINPLIGGPSGILEDATAQVSLMSIDYTEIVHASLDGNDMDDEKVNATQLKDDAKEKGKSLMPYAVGGNKIQWTALRNKYFTCAMISTNPEQIKSFYSEHLPNTDKNKDLPDNGGLSTGFIANPITLAPQQTQVLNFKSFIGPIKYATAYRADLISLHAYLEKKLSLICDLLLFLLNFFSGILGNWGIAIILLTVVVKGAIHPLTKKGMKSMFAMQRLQPKIKLLKEKYKNDRQRLGVEQMKLFKDEGANPMTGCLPMLLQMPIYLALYTSLRFAIELRQANFLWIEDLSQPENMFELGFSLPLIGSHFNLLPFLFSIAMFIQQKLTPKSPDPMMAQQQKMMTVVLPIMMFFMFYNMPAGLVLYWTVQNVLTLLEQRSIRAKYGPEKELSASKTIDAK